MSLTLNLVRERRSMPTSTKCHCRFCSWIVLTSSGNILVDGCQSDRMQVSQSLTAASFAERSISVSCSPLPPVY